MAVPFDHIAPTYDAVFSHSAIGQLHRKHVWDYMNRVLPQFKSLDMLELSRGSGEDSILFSDKGFNLVATDVSAEMLNVTQQKVQQYSMQNSISSHYLDLDSFDATVFNKKFDLIFSNFGGLNGVNPESMKLLFEKIPDILVPGGRFIGVIMPKFCAWEALHFLSRLRFKKVFGRLSSKETTINAEGVPTKVWYYNPGQIKKWSGKKFKIITSRPVGIAVPPAFHESYFTNKKRLLYFLNGLERRINRFSFLAAASDHYLIDLKLKR